MHIPDGYLSPSTCVACYAGAAPFWYVALKRAQRTLHSRMAPLLSVCSAFCFLIMMFNVPLPYGTSGHAVGMGVTAVVLGPWISILAISVALLIQALLFGDGGVTTLGANCLNMAVAGSLVASLVYTLLSGRAPLSARRRAVAAAIAGYVAINAAALLAALEFGMQPLLFHTAAGVPLYAPYPPGIAVSAMLAGHLTLAGLAEAAIAGGVIAWLQHSDIGLLAAHGAGAPAAQPVVRDSTPSSRDGWRFTRPFWIRLAGLMIATPLGLLAAGTAWGEWALDDFKNPAAREAIAAASRHIAPPAAPPSGLEHLAKIWAAPLPDYAPAFLKSAQLGYLLCAMIGVGIAIAAGLLLQALSKKIKS